MPLYNKSEAKKGGFAQVRDALIKFEGRVVRAEDGQWGSQGRDEFGNPLPPKEFFEIECTENVPIEVTEELSMDISDSFSFRVNMSEFEGSFWVDDFLASADKCKVLLPDGIIDKRVVFEKFTHSWEIDGKPISYTNFIISEVKGGTSAPAPKVVAKPAATAAKAPAATAPAPEPEAVEAEEPAAEAEGSNEMDAAMMLAVNKTEQQFRAAIQTAPEFANSPLLPMAKAGVVTQALVNDGRLVVDDKGKYQLPA